MPFGLAATFLQLVAAQGDFAVLDIRKLQNIEPCIESHIEARIHGEYWHSYSKLDSRTVSYSISWPKAPQC
jgi:hypothetical protein